MRIANTDVVLDACSILLGVAGHLPETDGLEVVGAVDMILEQIGEEQDDLSRRVQELAPKIERIDDTINLLDQLMAAVPVNRTPLQ